MIKSVMFAMCFTLLCSASAFAQDNGSRTERQTAYYVDKVPANNGALIAVYTPDQLHKLCRNASVATPVAQEVTPDSCCVKLGRKVRRYRAIQIVLRRDVNALQSRVATLEARDTVSPAEVEEALAPLRQSISELHSELHKALKSLNHSLNGRLDGLQAKLDKQALADDALLARIAVLESRFDEFEDRPEVVIVGLKTGLLLFGNTDDVTDYSVAAWMNAVRLDFRMSNVTYLYLQPGFLLTGGNNQPTGAMLDFGLGHRVYQSGDYAGLLEYGPSFIAMNLDSQLEAQVIGVAGSVGFSFLLPSNLRVGGRVLLGPSFDMSNPNLLYGGVLHFGGDLNR